MNDLFFNIKYNKKCKENLQEHLIFYQNQINHRNLYDRVRNNRLLEKMVMQRNGIREIRAQVQNNLNLIAKIAQDRSEVSIKSYKNTVLHVQMEVIQVNQQEDKFKSNLKIQHLHQNLKNRVNQLKVIQDGTSFLKQANDNYYFNDIYQQMKFIIFNILVYFVVSEVETVYEDGVEWTKMPIEFEEAEQPVENLQGGKGTTNYGTIDYGITEEMAKMFKTLNNPDYDVITRPIIKEIGLAFFESHYKKFCNTDQFFERLIYQGSNVDFNTINMIYHVKMSVNEFMVEFSLKNWDAEKNDFQIKEFTKCEIYVRQQKKQDL